MSSTYNYLIPENVAPANADKVGIYDSEGNRVGGVTIPSDCKLNTSELGEKLYSFGCISDVHYQYDTAPEDYVKALNYFKPDNGIEFVCICGDLTQGGSSTELEQYRYATASNKKVPVYAIAGNHEGNNTNISSVIETYTDHPLYYMFEKGNDVFIMFGCNTNTAEQLFTEDSLAWLYQKLEANRNKRVFLFQHVRPDDACGNAFGIYSYDAWGGKEATLFEAFLRHYKNVTFFHGHSHLKFYLQYGSNVANYDTVFGINSIHIPSLSVPRNGDASGASSRQEVYAESEGYVIDVYENYIILHGRDFVDDLFLPIATYKIPTQLVQVEANSFVNPTDIVISPVNITGIELSKTTDTGYIDGNIALSYTVTPSNYNISNLVWSTSNDTVATVIDGNATLLSAGTVTITLSDTISGVSANCVITVEEVPVSGENSIDFTTWTKSADALDYTLSNGEFTTTQTASGGYLQTSIPVSNFTVDQKVHIHYIVESSNNITDGIGIVASSTGFNDYNLINSYTGGTTRDIEFDIPISTSVSNIYLFARISGSAYSTAGGTYPVTYRIYCATLEAVYKDYKLTDKITTLSELNTKITNSDAWVANCYYSSNIGENGLLETSTVKNRGLFIPKFTPSEDLTVTITSSESISFKYVKDGTVNNTTVTSGSQYTFESGVDYYFYFTSTSAVSNCSGISITQ